jgi:hypothetical protein
VGPKIVTNDEQLAAIIEIPGDPNHHDTARRSSISKKGPTRSDRAPWCWPVKSSGPDRHRPRRQVTMCGVVRARTRAALASPKRARRERVGAVPYGFALKDDGAHLVAARAEQATIARARELRAAGLSLLGRRVHAGLRGTCQPSRLMPVSASAGRAHVGRSERARLAGRPIRGIPDPSRGTPQNQGRPRCRGDLS